MQIRVKCPAKINLDLKIINRREDGFHNIQSTMQTVNLFDYLTIKVEKSQNLSIKLSGTSNEIPYDEKNIVYKAVKLFFDMLGEVANIEIFIEKNIPVSAGLAGGSTNATGAIWGLNELFNRPFSRENLHELCSQLGSDLNFCLEGGCKRTFSRGEILENAEFVERKISLIKPINLGISAKEAYTKFAQKNVDVAEIQEKRAEFINDLEWAVIDDYEELQTIKRLYPNAIMTGSGSTYFAFDAEFAPIKGYWIVNNLKTINHGVCE